MKAGIAARVLHFFPVGISKVLCDSDGLVFLAFEGDAIQLSSGFLVHVIDPPPGSVWIVGGVYMHYLQVKRETEGLRMTRV
ncbi:MAG TPA: hypothetical protein PLE68_00965 [Bacillota bacterium]|nr:hypothetical protein [Bacillota bacterium]